MRLSHTPLYLTCALFSACGTSPITPSDKHINQPSTGAAQNSADIPLSNKRTIPLPAPKPSAKIETYSVVVSNVPAQEILFALARDAKINLDISSGIQGNVSINAINQTLPQILERISKQVDMRYELENGTLLVMPDKPFLKTYKIDFINMSRSAKSTNSTSSQITGGGVATAGDSGNAASTTVTSETKNDLMDSLINNVTAILLEEDRLRYKAQTSLLGIHQTSTRGDGDTKSTISDSGASPTNNKNNNNNNQNNNDDKSRTGASTTTGRGNQDTQGQNDLTKTTGVFEKSVNVFANKETGVLIVRATAKQHEKVQEFIDKVMATAKRQVLIEATIVEVELSDQYKQGINWSRLLLGSQGFALSQAGTVGLAGTAGALTLSYLDPTSKFGNILASVSLLETFGNVKVLSSPKLTVMNNQTASLKVAQNKVYFSVQAIIIPAQGLAAPIATYTSTAHSVSVGLTMSVTPQISDNEMVTINVRPSISSLIGLGVKDPNPALANPCGFGVISCAIAPIENRVPEIQTREMESIIKIENGQTAVMGGLIREEINKNSNEAPLLARIPFLGQLFQNRDDTTRKTELVIFLRPVVIKDAGLSGDFKEFSKNLPDADFFHEDARGTRTEH